MLTIPPDSAMLQALSGGIRCFQYRNKRGSRRQIYDMCLQLAEIAHQEKALFIVNDHADIAAAVSADGVHLGQDDLPIACARKLLPGKHIGISTHTIEQAKEAGAAGADYIGFGPIFKTGTKDAGPALGTDMIRLVKKTVSIPVIAIGGITSQNLPEVMRAGADGVAVISAICAMPDIYQASTEMMEILNNIRQ
ncbi:MAG: thiamine phosphate synthase [Nitrospirota bacterium]